MQKNAASQAGFTLLELLVALTLFAIIAVGAQAMLRSVLTAHTATHAHAEDMAGLQKTMQMLQQDFSQMDAPTLVTGGNDYAARFTRHGWSNPLGLPRGDRLRVAYNVENGVLTRTIWLAGEGDDADAERQSLLSGVANFTVAATTPALIDIHFTQSYFGDLNRAIAVVRP